MDPEEVTARFNDRIDARDVDGLAGLMTDDHRFVDAAGETVEGKQRCLDRWQEFFELFPDYENVFTAVTSSCSRVTMVGCSTCSDERLAGPAIWTAGIRDDAVAEWRVHVDTKDTRRRLDVDRSEP